MQERLLKKIITDFAGPDSEKLVDLLYKKQNVNEFLIAKRMDLTINQTRNMLYKLGDEGLVKFIRKKDKKKGGWYTYFWTLKIKRCLLKYKERVDNEIEKLEKQQRSIKLERHYYCENCDLNYNEESALLNEYTCPECGETLKIKDTTKTSEHIDNEIKRLRSTLAQLKEDIEEIEKKEEKSKERRLKLEKKKKEEERKRRRLEREKEKKKAMKGKKIPKKKVKKKPAKKVKKKPAKKKTTKKAKKKPTRNKPTKKVKKKVKKEKTKKSSFMKVIKKFSKKRKKG